MGLDDNYYLCGRIKLIHSDKKVKVRAKIFAGILLFLFIGQLADASLFPHSHFVDGHVIAHSHPYSGTPASPHHEHCKSQLILIAMMSVAVLAAAAVMLPDIPGSRDAGLFVKIRETFVERPRARHNYLRGPPAVSPLSF